MRSMTVAIIVSWTVACGGAGDDAAETAAVDSTALAAAVFDQTVFDTLTWVADSAALARGGVVWSYSCMKCHGVTGIGDGGFVLQGDTVRPPSMLAADWQFANDLNGLRRYIFAGNNQGMPHWGVVGLKARDIDAVAHYILVLLRPPTGL